MKKRFKVVKWMAIGITSVGIIVVAVILTMYCTHHAQVESKISDFKQNVEQLHENPTGKSDSDNNGQSDNKGKSETDRDTDEGDYGRSNWETPTKSSVQIDIEALKRDSLALDLTKYGIFDNIYGYVSAPSIGMELPIYLGANDGTMSYGAGHLCYTSLPTGGADTNAVLAGHTGYIGRWLFDSVSSLSVGDEVSVTTYFGKLDYRVTRVLNRAPNDSDILFIEKGKDKLTLITCIDGGSARRVVVCER